MSSLVVVALPSEDDYVNRISSEVAHMTILFLGEDVNKVANFPKIVEFVQHAADLTLVRFGMEVDHRGELGPDQADVLFFSKTKWSGYKGINEFRSNLLKSDAIRTAYDSTEQFPEWRPHLTLGYPETPAHPDTRDYPGIQYVNFDRIAVWFQTDSGIEIPLKSHNWDADMAMSSIDEGKVVVQDILEHHGIKGMHWGVRKEDSTSAGDTHSKTQKKADKKLAKADKKWENERSSVNAAVAIHNRSADHFNAKISEYNKKFEGVDLTDEHSPARQKYDKGAFRLMNETYAKAHNELYGTSPSGKFKIHMYVDSKGDSKVVYGETEGVNKALKQMGIKHGIDNIDALKPDPKIVESLVFSSTVVRDEQGLIVELQPDSSDLTQSGMVLVEDILEHHGIKGMKWGIRKAVHPDIADVPKGTRKAAQRDAEEHTRAKMFFGEGAGTRRKLINARVEARKKKDPLYAKAFDHFVKQTDMAKRASQARKERKRKDNSKVAGRLLKDVLLAQSGADLVGDVLEHHGVKGMKWGVRRDHLSGVASEAHQTTRRKAGLAGPQEVKLKDKRKKLKTSGGQGHSAHDDAVVARTIGQKGKGSGLKALSNRELETYAKRLQLEQNVTRLNYNEKNRGQKFVADYFKSKEGKKTVRDIASSDVVTSKVKHHIAKRIVKGVSKAAAVAAA